MWRICKTCKQSKLLETEFSKDNNRFWKTSCKVCRAAAAKASYVPIGPPEEVRKKQAGYLLSLWKKTHWKKPTPILDKLAKDFYKVAMVLLKTHPFRNVAVLFRKFKFLRFSNIAIYHSVLNRQNTLREAMLPFVPRRVDAVCEPAGVSQITIKPRTKTLIREEAGITTPDSPSNACSYSNEYVNKLVLSMGIPRDRVLVALGIAPSSA